MIPSFNLPHSFTKIRAAISQVIFSTGKYIHYRRSHVDKAHFGRNNSRLHRIRVYKPGDNPIRDKHWPILRWWPFARDRLEPPSASLVALCSRTWGCISPSLSRGHVSRAGSFSSDKYVGRGMIYSCRTIFVSGRRVVCRGRRTKSSGRGVRVKSTLYVLFLMNTKLWNTQGTRCYSD